VGRDLIELRQKTGELRFIIAAIIRHNRLIIPTGKSHIRTGDLVYCVCEKPELEDVLGVFGSRPVPIRHVLIIGGGNIGAGLAQRLENTSLHVRLIEKNRDKCDVLADQLDRTIVLNGDGTDQELLEEENIQSMDVVVAVTDDEENNILSSLLARQLGARRTITRINKIAYMPIAAAVGLGHIVSPRLSAVNTILRHIRKGKVLSAVTLKGEEAEVLEAVAQEHSGIVGRPLKEMQFPSGALVLAALRGGESLIPSGETIIEPQDRVIILATRKAIPRVERELMVKLEYF
jgi:trk system potassium uptake protein TrkA